MGPDRKEQSLQALAVELQRRQAQLESLQHATQTASPMSITNHSSERIDLGLDRDIAEDAIRGAKSVQRVIENAGPCREIALGACFTARLIEEDTTLTGILAPVRMNLGDISTITPDSPLGKAVVGKQAGDFFVYGEDNKAGLVYSVE